MNGIVIAMLSSYTFAGNYYSTVPTTKQSRFRYGSEKATNLITT